MQANQVPLKSRDSTAVTTSIDIMNVIDHREYYQFQTAYLFPLYYRLSTVPQA